MMLKSLPGCALGMFSLSVALWIHSSKDPNIKG